jgi:hypothetical protein
VNARQREGDDLICQQLCSCKRGITGLQEWVYWHDRARYRGMELHEIGTEREGGVERGVWYRR